LVDFAKENDMKVAVNPSKQQLSLPQNELKIFTKSRHFIFKSRRGKHSYSSSIWNEQEILRK